MASDSQNKNSNDALWIGRLVPTGREGNKVLARSLRPGEEDTGEVVNAQSGEELIIRGGDLIINSGEIDVQSPKGRGGYAPGANTIWTWFTIVGAPSSLLVFSFSLARRLDAAHELWAMTMQRLQEARSQLPIERRIASSSALATAEMATIALHRAIEMLQRLLDKYCPELTMPETVKTHRQALSELRRAFEHIDERAEGKVGMSGKLDLQALNIFDQPDLFESSVLSYNGYSLDFDGDVIAVLFACRRLVIDTLEVLMVSQIGSQDSEEA